MLFAHPIVSDSTALRRLEQHDYAKDTTKHGRGGLWLHVIYPKTIDIPFNDVRAFLSMSTAKLETSQ